LGREVYCSKRPTHIDHPGPELRRSLSGGRSSARGWAKPTTARAEPNLRSQTQEDAGFARVRSREAGPSIA